MKENEFNWISSRVYEYDDQKGKKLTLSVENGFNSGIAKYISYNPLKIILSIKRKEHSSNKVSFDCDYSNLYTLGTAFIDRAKGINKVPYSSFKPINLSKPKLEVKRSINVIFKEVNKLGVAYLYITDPQSDTNKDMIELPMNIFVHIAKLLENMINNYVSLQLEMVNTMNSEKSLRYMEQTTEQNQAMLDEMKSLIKAMHNKQTSKHTVEETDVVEERELVIDHKELQKQFDEELTDDNINKTVIEELDALKNERANRVNQPVSFKISFINNCLKNDLSNLSRLVIKYTLCDENTSKDELCPIKKILSLSFPDDFKELNLILNDPNLYYYEYKMIQYLKDWTRETLTNEKIDYSNYSPFADFHFDENNKEVIEFGMDVLSCLVCLGYINYKMGLEGPNYKDENSIKASGFFLRILFFKFIENTIDKIENIDELLLERIKQLIKDGFVKNMIYKQIKWDDEVFLNKIIEAAISNLNGLQMQPTEPDKVKLFKSLKDIQNKLLEDNTEENKTDVETDPEELTEEEQRILQMSEEDIKIENMLFGEQGE